MLEGSVKTRKVHVATPDLNTCQVNTDAEGIPGCMMAIYSPLSKAKSCYASVKAREQHSSNPFMKKGSRQQRHQGRGLPNSRNYPIKEGFCCQSSSVDDFLNQLRTYFNPSYSTSFYSLSTLRASNLGFQPFRREEAPNQEAADVFQEYGPASGVSSRSRDTDSSPLRRRSRNEPKAEEAMFSKTRRLISVDAEVKDLSSLPSPTRHETRASVIS